MSEGFKLLDAYVEVKADATGVGSKVSEQFTKEIAPAAKKMADAVEAATRQATAATKRQEDAAASLRLAQLRLNDVQKTAAEGSTQLVSAQERVAAAQRNVAAATVSAERAQRDLGSAQVRMKEAGASSGSNFFSGLKGAVTTGMVGGLVGGITSSVTSGITSLISGAVSDIGGMLSTVGGMVATTVIDFNSELQNANIGFTTMLGSGQKAKVFLDDLQNFAKTTPFEFGNLVHNAQSMMGMGIAAKAVIPDLTALGDSVASIGGSASQVDSVVLAFDQMNAKGTLDMGNMNQLMENGVPSALKVMAAAYHVTTGQMIGMISTGKVQASVALPALVKGIEKGTKATAALGGMMDKQSTTFTGALSNIQDGLTQTVSKAFKPFFDVASKGMQQFATALSGKPAQKFTADITKTLKPFASEIGKWFKGIDIGKIFTAAGKGLQGMLKDIKPKDVIQMFKDIGKGAIDIGKAIIPMVPKIIKVIKDFGPALMGVVKWFIDTTTAFADGADQWHDIFNAIGKWFNDTVKAFQDGWNQIAGFFSGAVDNFKTGSDQLNGFFKGIEGFFSDVVHNFADGAHQLNGFFDGVVRNFGQGANQIVGFFKSIPGTVTTIGRDIVNGLLGGIRGAWGAVTDTVSHLVNLIPAGVRKLLGIASPSKVFHLIGTQVGQGLHRGLLGSVDQIKTASGQLADAVTSGFTGHNVAKNVARIHSVAKVLERLSAARDKATANLAGAKSNLATVLANRSSLADSVKANVMGNADVTGIFGTAITDQSAARQAALDANAAARQTAKDAAAPVTSAAGLTTLNGASYQPSWTTTTAGAKSAAVKLQAVHAVTNHSGLVAVRASLRKLLADTKKFSSNLSRLLMVGIDPTTYDQLVQAGVEGGGLETSNAFLADPKMARSIFSLERQIGKAGGALGAKTAGHEFAGQVATARAAVSHDQRVVNHINVHMVVEAKKIDEVQKLVHMVAKVKQTARKK